MPTTTEARRKAHQQITNQPTIERGRQIEFPLGSVSREACPLTGILCSFASPGSITSFGIGAHYLAR
ncbi:MAG: hypothetical protein ACREM8_09890, partial [Vulcanimicrobiaceae bacterium]